MEVPAHGAIGYGPGRAHGPRVAISPRSGRRRHPLLRSGDQGRRPRPANALVADGGSSSFGRHVSPDRVLVGAPAAVLLLHRHASPATRLRPCPVPGLWSRPDIGVAPTSTQCAFRPNGAESG